jgi:hypothetical protein
MPFTNYLLYSRADLRYTCYPILEGSGIIGLMERKYKITVYLPQKLYIEICERRLDHHFSFLVSLLVEEFLKKTDVRISWREMPTIAEEMEYLERRVREFFSQQEKGLEKPVPLADKPEPAKEEPQSQKTLTQKEFLRRLD